MRMPALLVLSSLALACQSSRLASVPVPVPVPPPESPRSNLLATIAGFQAPGRALQGKETGLLLPPNSRWGRTLRANRQPNVPGIRPSPDLEHYVFHPEGEVRPWTVIFRCARCGEHWHEALPMLSSATKQEGTAPGSALGPSDDSPWPLKAPALLVSVEVNGGAGSTRELDYFIATSVTRRPEELPVLLDAASAALARHVASESPRALALYAQEWKAPSTPTKFADVAPLGTTAPKPLEDTLLFPRWDSARGKLHVFFIHRWQSTARALMENLDETPCGFPSRNHQIRVSPYVIVETGLKVEVSSDGAVAVLEAFGTGVLDDQAQHLAEVPQWDHQSRRRCPEYGNPH